MELVLNTYGVSLSRDNNAFVITSKDARQRIPTEGVTSIQICRGVQVTSDAIFLAVENEIDILFADRNGMPVGRVWSPQYGSISTIRKGQLAFSFSSDALTWIKEVICRKIENQEAVLLMMQTDDEELERRTRKAISRLEDYRTKVNSLKGEIVADVAPSLRGWEGLASNIYFAALNEYMPPQYRFEKRSQRPAMDVVNAFLNYGYGILYGKIEAALIKAGIDMSVIMKTESTLFF